VLQAFGQLVDKKTLFSFLGKVRSFYNPYTQYLQQYGNNEFLALAYDNNNKISKSDHPRYGYRSKTVDTITTILLPIPSHSSLPTTTRTPLPPSELKPSNLSPTPLKHFVEIFSSLYGLKS
jgi:hypothetical protein